MFVDELVGVVIEDEEVEEEAHERNSLVSWCLHGAKCLVCGRIGDARLSFYGAFWERFVDALSFRSR